MKAVTPDPARTEIRVLDTTPAVVEKFASHRGEALLARVRYNRLVELFTAAACYLLPTDCGSYNSEAVVDLYVGVTRRGAECIFPVHAVASRKRLYLEVVERSRLICASRFRTLLCRPIAAHSLGDDLIALYEVEARRGQIGKLDEAHYRLVPAAEFFG
ncbi:MAG TPA: hypothetical protein VF157_05240 [Chloroflexota bacterium]